MNTCAFCKNIQPVGWVYSPKAFSKGKRYRAQFTKSFTDHDSLAMAQGAVCACHDKPLGVILEISNTQSP